MKRSLFFLLACLLFSAFTVPSSLALSNNNESKSVQEDPNIPQRTALDVANDYLASTIIPFMYPSWKNATLRNPVLFLNSSDGSPAVYSISVEKNGVAVGHIIVGATKNISPIISISNGPEPTKNMSAIVDMAKKRLLRNQKLGDPKLIYNGPMNLEVSFGLLENEKETSQLTYNLAGKFLVNQSHSLQYDDAYKKQANEQWNKYLSNPKKSTITPLATITSKDLSVISYDQNNLPSDQSPEGCGPAAGANIMNFWDRQGYSSLQSSTDETTGVELMKQLYTEMSTEIASDLWNNLVNEINAGRPLAMYFGVVGDPYTYHFVTARGWLLDNDYGTKKYHVNTWGYDTWNDWASSSGFSLIYVRPY